MKGGGRYGEGEGEIRAHALSPGAASFPARTLPPLFAPPTACCVTFCGDVVVVLFLFPGTGTMLDHVCLLFLLFSVEIDWCLYPGYIQRFPVEIEIFQIVDPGSLAAM